VTPARQGFAKTTACALTAQAVAAQPEALQATAVQAVAAQPEALQAVAVQAVAAQPEALQAVQLPPQSQVAFR